MRTVFLIGVLALAASALTGCVDGDESYDENEGQGEAETVEQALVRRSSFKLPDVSDRADALARYPNLDPGRIVPRDLLGGALAFLDLNRSRVANEKYVSVLDFSKHSSKRRLFILDMQSGKVESHVVAHGSGSDPLHTGFAKRFSNQSGSNASSVGYYLTAETYYGQHGYSLRLDGISDTNSNARSRAVVIHASSYVDDGRAKQGRSQGCPAVSFDDSDEIIQKLKGGSVLFAQRTGHLDD